MHAKLCDRCLSCAHEILMRYEFKTKFNNKDEVFTHISNLLSYVNEDHKYSPLNIFFEIENLNLILNLECTNCLNINKMNARENIRIFVRIYIVDKIFKCVIENELLRSIFLKMKILNRY